MPNNFRAVSLFSVPDFCLLFALQSVLFLSTLSHVLSPTSSLCHQESKTSRYTQEYPNTTSPEWRDKEERNFRVFPIRRNTRWSQSRGRVNEEEQKEKKKDIQKRQTENEDRIYKNIPVALLLDCKCFLLIPSRPLLFNSLSLSKYAFRLYSSFVLFSLFLFQLFFTLTFEFKQNRNSFLFETIK